MPEPAKRTVPSALIERLDASVRDIATGAVHNAAEIQSEMRRMLANYESATPPAGDSAPAKRTGTA